MPANVQLDPEGGILLFSPESKPLLEPKTKHFAFLVSDHLSLIRVCLLTFLGQFDWRGTSASHVWSTSTELITE